MARVIALCLTLVTLLLGGLPFAPGFAAYDAEIGLGEVSPFNHPILQIDSTIQRLETGFSNYYSAPLDIAQQQLYALYWGSSWRHNQHTFSATITALSAFDLYQEFMPTLGYAYSFNTSLTIGSEITSSRHSADTLSQWSGEISGGVLWGNSNVSGACIVRVEDIPFGFSQPIAFSIRTMVRTTANTLGSQGVSCSYNTLSEQLSFSFATHLPITPWWSLNFALKTVPLFIQIGTKVKVKRVQVGVLMSKHTELGWCQTISLGYRY